MHLQSAQKISLTRKFFFFKQHISNYCTYRRHRKVYFFAINFNWWTHFRKNHDNFFAPKVYDLKKTNESACFAVLYNIYTYQCLYFLDHRCAKNAVSYHLWVLWCKNEHKFDLKMNYIFCRNIGGTYLTKWSYNIQGASGIDARFLNQK
jgi:hypothetical protein